MSKNLSVGANQHSIGRSTSTRNSYKVYPGIGKSSPSPYWNFRESFREVQNKVLDLRSLRERKLDEDLISLEEKTALAWIEEMYRTALESSGKWIDPHVSQDNGENIVFEWWKGNKELTVYVSSESKEYLKVWGADIFSEMEDGDIDKENSQALWRWLTTD